jgi:hypothetical protein
LGVLTLKSLLSTEADESGFRTICENNQLWRMLQTSISRNGLEGLGSNAAVRIFEEAEVSERF